MSVIEHIKKLPKGRLGHVEHMPVPDDYRSMKTDDFIALAESHERLLAVSKQAEVHWESLRADRVLPEALLAELKAAIEEAEKL